MTMRQVDFRRHLAKWMGRTEIEIRQYEMRLRKAGLFGAGGPGRGGVNSALVNAEQALLLALMLMDGSPPNQSLTAARRYLALRFFWFTRTIATAGDARQLHYPASGEGVPTAGDSLIGLLHDLRRGVTNARPESFAVGRLFGRPMLNIILRSDNLSTIGTVITGEFTFYPSGTEASSIEAASSSSPRTTIAQIGGRFFEELAELLGPLGADEVAPAPWLLGAEHRPTEIGIDEMVLAGSHERASVSELLN